MFDPDCIFCKIIQKNVSSKIIKETVNILVIEDLNPKAPYHYLILPKKHIVNLSFVENAELSIVSEMLSLARDLSKEIAIKDNLQEPIHFNLISNNGVNAGQSVFHMHWHFLAGKNIYKNGLEL